MKFKLVGTSPAREAMLKQVHNENDRARNVFGLVLDENDLPVICGHGGSGLLCVGCGEVLLSGKSIPRLQFKKPDDYGFAKSYKTNIDVMVEKGIAEYV